MSSTDRSVYCYIQLEMPHPELNDEEGSLDIPRGFLVQRTRDTDFGAVRK